MCDEKAVMQRVKLAKGSENPQEAAKYYLEAAQMLVELSEKTPEKDGEFMDMATMGCQAGAKDHQRTMNFRRMIHPT